MGCCSTQGWPHSKTVRRGCGVSKSFVRKWEKRYRDVGNCKRKVGSGRPGPTANVKRLVRKHLRKTNSSSDTVRRLGIRHHISIHRTNVWRIAKRMRMNEKNGKWENI